MPPRPKTTVEEVVEGVVSRYSARNLRAIIICAFLAGCWATKLQIDLLAAREALGVQQAATNERIKEWSGWRDSIAGKLAVGEWTLKDHEGRIVSLEKRP